MARRPLTLPTKERNPGLRPPIAILAGLIGTGIVAFLCRGMHAEAIADGLRHPIQQSLTSLGVASTAVDVDGRDATLRGIVDSEAAKLKAGEVAAEQWGTHQVNNLLEVRATTPAPAPPPVASLNCQAEFADILKAGQPLFAGASSVLSPTSYPLLDRIAQAAAKCPAAGLVVGGHTDSIGPLPYNLELSRARANSVLAYLTTKGIAAARIEATGFGPHQPVADNTSEAGMRKNRRIEIKVKGL